MDYLFKLIAVILLSLSTTLSSAETIPATYQDTSPTYRANYGSGYKEATSPQAAADMWCAQFGQSGCTVNTSTSWVLYVSGSWYAGGGIDIICQAGSTWNGTTCRSALSCPANQGWTLSGTSCIRPDCPAGQVYVNGVCGDPPPPACNLVANQSVPNVTGQYHSLATGVRYTHGMNVCLGGCLFSTTSGATGSNNGSNVQAIVQVGKPTGASCTESSHHGAGDIENDANGTVCPTCKCLLEGKGYGYVNGNVVCVKAGPGNEVEKNTSKTTTNTDSTGETSKTEDKSVKVNEDGTVTTTTNTTTTTPGGGTVVDTNSKTQDKDDFCQENPESMLCKKSSINASCASFTCDGDAVQCAIAKEIYQRNCQLMEGDSDEKNIFDNIKAGADTVGNPADGENREGFELPTQLDTSRTLTSGCLADKVIAVGSTSVTIPFSELCPYLNIMGQIAVAITLVVAGRIVGGAIS